MAKKLLDLLGYDRNDPRVAAGRRHGAAIARLIDSLVQIRDKRNLTQSDVAERMDTTQSSVSNFERQGGDPKVSTLFRYADAVGADLDFIVDPVDPIMSQPHAPVVPRAAEAATRSGYTTSRFEVAVH
ncbi:MULTISPECIES: helix-turn-helix domain-containing protein [Amycolatopsis]|uniref:Helix-turn-helix domain-containing protein n=1 Tax=Amycolatopsis albidoflavus TaxID=102226 RepID=A0ABW5IGG2_9PSEU